MLGALKVVFKEAITNDAYRIVICWALGSRIVPNHLRHSTAFFEIEALCAIARFVAFRHECIDLQTTALIVFQPLPELSHAREFLVWQTISCTCSCFILRDTKADSVSCDTHSHYNGGVRLTTAKAFCVGWQMFLSIGHEREPATIPNSMQIAVQDCFAKIKMPFRICNQNVIKNKPKSRLSLA